MVKTTTELRIPGHDGAYHYPLFFDRDQQAALALDILEVIQQAPLFTSHMPKTGAPMSVLMTNCGSCGWLSDQARGYRYEARHPTTGQPWPPITQSLLQAWDRLTEFSKPPEACLINVYTINAKMALHQDRDEADLDAPILSVSLGFDCRFKMGGPTRNAPSANIILASGDALVLSGPARRSFHGVDRVLPTLGADLPEALSRFGVRINLTLRRVT